MNYARANNPLYEWYHNSKRRARKNNSVVYPEWETWRGFAKWCASHGYDENVKLHYTSHNPFTPEYLGTKRPAKYDFEYIAYDAEDPYELIITSAPYLTELSEKLKRLGYDYDVPTIKSYISLNAKERPIESRARGLVFEKIDLSNYNEDGEPFEERN